MSKLSIAVLLLSSLYLATALSDAPWAPLQQGIYENSPFLIGLTNIGGQNNLGQAFDSRIFNTIEGEVGDVLSAWFQDDDRGFTYIAGPQLVLEGGQLHSSKYAIRVDSETGRRDVVWWSLQQLLEVDFLPTGTNITWDADTGAVTVTRFEGLDQFLQYQGLRPFNESNSTDVVSSDDDDDTEVIVSPDEETDVVLNPGEDTDVVVSPDEEIDVVVDPDENTDVVVNDTDTDVADVVVDNTNNSNVAVDTSNPTVEVYDTVGDYLRNFVGYQPQDAGIYDQDEFLNNAVNNAVSQVADRGNLENLVLTNLTTLDTLPGDDGNTRVRLTGDVTSDTNVGNIVAVILCATDGNCDNGSLQYWWWNSVILG